MYQGAWEITLSSRCAALSDAIRDRAFVPVDPHEALGVIRVIEAARESAAHGETTRLAR